MTEIVNLNVGGIQYSVARSTIMKYEETMLAKLVSEKWNPQSSEAPIFIDRDGERFKFILDFYRDGEIIVPNTFAIDAVKNDALYFGLPENANIKESNKSLSLKDLPILWATVAMMRTQQSFDAAALWGVEEFLREIATPTRVNSGKIFHINMRTYDKSGNIMNSASDRFKLVNCMNDILLSLEKVILSASCVSVEEYNSDYVVFKV
jgi:hypothetical protein